MTREEVISLSARIAELRNEIAKLQHLQKDRQKELRELEMELDEALGIEQVVDRAERESLGKRILAIFQGSPNETFSPEGLSAALNAKLHSTRSVLSRLVKAGEVTKIRRGEYRLADRNQLNTLGKEGESVT